MNDLISVYRQKLNLENAPFERIEHDDAIVAIVYKITQSNGQSYILKICPYHIHYQRELYGLQKFAHILPVAKIIQTVAPEQNLYGAILMQCLPGSVGSAKNFTMNVAYQAGVYLAQIHTHRTAGYGEVIEPNNFSNDPFSYFEQKLTQRSAECGNYLSQKLLTQVHDYFEKHKKLLETVDGPCMIHRDFRPGNILIDQGKISGIIDWAGMYSAFAEEDFLYLEHYHGLPMDQTTKQAFLDGYASIRPVPDFQKIMPLLRLNKAIGTLKFIIKTDTIQGRNAALYQYNYDFLNKFFNKGEIMAIACSTCHYMMTKVEAFGYCVSDIITLAKAAYELYKITRKGIIEQSAQGLLVTTLNLKKVACPVCLKYKGWSQLLLEQ